jgi:E3 ubiquitin-protein ligase HUWE1
MFHFVGKIIGKALWDLQLLDCSFVKALYKILLQQPLSYHDLEDYDPELYKNLNWMISNKEVDAICSYFVVDQQFFGEQQEIELCEGGKDKLVTDENKHDYVQLVANQRLYKAIST